MNVAWRPALDQGGKVEVVIESLIVNEAPKSTTECCIEVRSLCPHHGLRLAMLISAPRHLDLLMNRLLSVLHRDGCEPARKKSNWVHLHASQDQPK